MLASPSDNAFLPRNGLHTNFRVVALSAVVPLVRALPALLLLLPLPIRVHLVHPRPLSFLFAKLLRCCCRPLLVNPR